MVTTKHKMTTKEFLLEKELNWTRIEEMREEIKRNQKIMDNLFERNNELYDRMKNIVQEMQEKAEKLDKDYV